MRLPGRLTAIVLTVACLAGSGMAFSAQGSKGPAAPDGAARDVLAAGRSHLGDDYVWAAEGPHEWDCSGLTSVLWREVGHARRIPRTSREQQAWAWPVTAKEALPGDLVFFGDPVSHVGFYLGDGKMLDASKSRGHVVLREVWDNDVVRYGRVPRSTVARPGHASAATKAVSTPKARPRPAPWHSSLGPIHTRFAVIARRSYGRRIGFNGRPLTPLGLVRLTWYKAAHRTLPMSLKALLPHTERIRERQLTAGDLIVYANNQIAVYVGGGMMVDFSKARHRVVYRPVVHARYTRFARIHTWS